jgi:hypothetical protein
MLALPLDDGRVAIHCHSTGSRAGEGRDTMPTLPMTAQIDHVVRYLRKQGKSRDEVLYYFATEDRPNAGAEYDRQLAELAAAEAMMAKRPGRPAA